MRKVTRTAQPSDYILVDFVVASDSQLLVKTEPTSEMGMDRSILQQFFPD